MKQAGIEDIKQLVERIGRASNLSDDLRQVEVEPREDGDGDSYLSVSLYVGHPERIEWDNVADLVTSIEDRVREVDDRFPSVHFRKAA